MDTFKPEEKQKTLNNFQELIELSKLDGTDLEDAISDWEENGIDGFKNLLNPEVRNADTTV